MANTNLIHLVSISLRNVMKVNSPGLPNVRASESCDPGLFEFEE